MALFSGGSSFFNYNVLKEEIIHASQKDCFTTAESKEICPEQE